MDTVVLTAEQLAHIVCLPRQRQLDLLKELTEGNNTMVWHEETHEWVIEAEE